MVQIYFLLAVLMGFFAGSASASSLYSTDANRNTLVKINPDTGEAVEIGIPGTLGFSVVGALDFSPTTGALYGIAQLSDQLISIDPVTGVGTMAGTGTTGVGQSGQGAIGAIAFAADGTLYGLDQYPAGLVTIDLATGAATRVVANPPLVFADYTGMAFSADGTLYATTTGNKSLYTVDVGTGAPSLVGQITSTSTGILVNMASGLAFAPDGTLYFLEGSTLHVLDPVTAEATPIGANGLGTLPLTYGPTPVGVPEPTAASLALAGLTVMMGLLTFRRNPRPFPRPLES